MIFALGLFPNYFKSRIDPTVTDFLAVYTAKMEALRDPQGARTRPVLLDESVLRPAGAPGPRASAPTPRRDVLLAQGD